MTESNRPTNLRQLRESGWVSRTVKQEIHDNFLASLASGEELFGGVTFFLYFQLFDIAALRFVSLRTKGKAAMLAVA